MLIWNAAITACTVDINKSLRKSLLRDGECVYLCILAQVSSASTINTMRSDEKPALCLMNTAYVYLQECCSRDL